MLVRKHTTTWIGEDENACLWKGRLAFCRVKSKHHGNDSVYSGYWNCSFSLDGENELLYQTLANQSKSEGMFIAEGDFQINPTLPANSTILDDLRAKVVHSCLKKGTFAGSNGEVPHLDFFIVSRNAVKYALGCQVNWFSRNTGHKPVLLDVLWDLDLEGDVVDSPSHLDSELPYGPQWEDEDWSQLLNELKETTRMCTM